MSAGTIDDVAIAILQKLSPSGALEDIASANPELDALLRDFDAEELAIQKLTEKTLVDRLEDDFARCVPAIVDAAVPLEAWAIPLLSALAGPCAPLLSMGLATACKVALLALTAWSKKRIGK
jgi:hypothetical protein